MSFSDEMRELSEDYDKGHSHQDDRIIEECINRIKSRIRAEIARGAKQVSINNWLCFSTWNVQREAAVFDVQMGLTRAEIRWELTQNMKDMLSRLKEAATKEGIEITDYSFILGNGGGDDSRSYDNDRFFEDSGVLYISRKYCKLYMSSIKNSRQWHIFVDCSFRFSV